MPLLLLLGGAAYPAAGRDVPYCQWLDRVDRPAWELQAGYVDQARVEAPDGHRYAVYEFSGGGGLFYGAAPGGSVDLSGAYALHAFEGDGGLDLPNQTLDAHLDAAYAWRSWDGRSLRLRAQPGLYGEVDGLDGSAFQLPLEILGVQALSPQLSGQLGVALYPGYQRSFDPRFGVRYALSDTWSVDLQYPESRVLWREPAGREAYFLIRNDPINEYSLESGDPRRALRWEETRAVVGWVQPLGGAVRLRVEAGYVFNRSVDFARGSPPRAVEDAVMVGLGFGGAL